MRHGWVETNLRWSLSRIRRGSGGDGGDNLAAYTPVFATITAGAIAVTIAVFAVGVALWCLLGSWLVVHRRATEVLQRWGHWIIPAVYILIGLYILQQAGAP